jgi:hypothetical protein
MGNRIGDRESEESGQPDPICLGSRVTSGKEADGSREVRRAPGTPNVAFGRDQVPQMMMHDGRISVHAQISTLLVNIRTL